MLVFQCCAPLHVFRLLQLADASHSAIVGMEGSVDSLGDRQDEAIASIQDHQNHLVNIMQSVQETRAQLAAQRVQIGELAASIAEDGSSSPQLVDSMHTQQRQLDHLVHATEQILDKADEQRTLTKEIISNQGEMARQLETARKDILATVDSTAARLRVRLKATHANIQHQLNTIPDSVHAKLDGLLSPLEERMNEALSLMKFELDETIVTSHEENAAALSTMLGRLDEGMIALQNLQEQAEELRRGSDDVVETVSNAAFLVSDEVVQAQAAIRAIEHAIREQLVQHSLSSGPCPPMASPNGCVLAGVPAEGHPVLVSLHCNADTDVIHYRLVPTGAEADVCEFCEYSQSQNDCIEIYASAALECYTKRGELKSATRAFPFAFGVDQELQQSIGRVERMVTEMPKQMDRWGQTVLDLHEYDTPFMFRVEPLPASGQGADAVHIMSMAMQLLRAKNGAALLQLLPKCRIRLVCMLSWKAVPCGPDGQGYEVPVVASKQTAKAVRGALKCAFAAALALDAVLGIARLVGIPAPSSNLRAKVGELQALLDKAPVRPNFLGEGDQQLEGASYREFCRLLKDQDKSEWYGGLQKFRNDDDGRVFWALPENEADEEDADTVGGRPAAELGADGYAGPPNQIKLEEKIVVKTNGAHPCSRRGKMWRFRTVELTAVVVPGASFEQVDYVPKNLPKDHDNCTYVKMCRGDEVRLWRLRRSDNNYQQLLAVIGLPAAE